jgi:deoxyribodipyrimidine photo-lyase
MIQDTRIRNLNVAREAAGEYILYWMQASQRLRCNHSLMFAIRIANERNLPVLVAFGLTDSLPGANERHYAFMLEGLRDVSSGARKRGLGFALLKGSPDDVAIKLAGKAAVLVTDRGYLRVQRDWRTRVAKSVACPVVEVESDAVVPAACVSEKEEYAARTIRPKIHRVLPNYLRPLVETKVRVPFKGSVPGAVAIDDVDGLLATLSIDRSVGRPSGYVGGEKEAARRLGAFIEGKLTGYAVDRNDPNLDGVSNLSPYLHFGQISPLDIAIQIRDARGGSGDEGVDTFLEELIVRRELSINFCIYQPLYDQYACLPEWAQLTLGAHREDPRAFQYSREQFEHAETHDPYWNAAQVEMTATGKMHNYMRMYWGKKIIEWSATPEEAFATALALNNKYELDGMDVNSFAGVAWCFGKHDRPWKEREVFGTVRFMNANGLKRKFDRDGYVEKIARVSGRPASLQASLF